MDNNQRLSEYEKTGLTPSEIETMKRYYGYETSQEFEKFRRLVELEEADNEGRVVIIPKGNYVFTLKSEV